VNPEGRVWIPNSKLLRKRIYIIAHCGVNGHRGKTATLRSIEGFFYWDCLEEDVKQFCRMCLHCIGSLNSKVPRPLGEALHASRRNQVIHYDFLFVKNTGKFSHALVLKDDVSHFAELVPSERTDHVVVVHTLVDWYKRFGVPETHFSDKGSHFKNTVVAELNDILKAPYTKGRRRLAYSFQLILNSDTRLRRTFMISRFTLSTVPLLFGEYAVVK